MLGRPLHEVFHLAYGVSTGSIIASMIALGDPVDPTIADRYFELAPDVLGPLGVSHEDIRILSVGTGSYPETRKWTRRIIAGIRPLKTYMTLSRTSSNTVDTLREFFFPDIKTLRIDESFTDSAYETDFMEHDPRKLRSIFQLGRKSFESAEARLWDFFKDAGG